MDDALRLYTIYHPARPGEPFTVRVFWTTPGGPVAGPVIGFGATLAQVRATVPASADYNLRREPDDDPTIVETWI